MLFYNRIIVTMLAKESYSKNIFPTKLALNYVIWIHHNYRWILLIGEPTIFKLPKSMRGFNSDFHIEEKKNYYYETRVRQRVRSGKKNIGVNIAMRIKAFPSAFHSRDRSRRNTLSFLSGGIARVSLRQDFPSPHGFLLYFPQLLLASSRHFGHATMNLGQNIIFVFTKKIPAQKNNFSSLRIAASLPL